MSSSPGQLRQRKKTVSSREKTEMTELRSMNPERRKTTEIPAPSNKKTKVVHPYQPSPPSVPALPEGKTTIDINLNISAEKAFEMFFTDSDFYKGWLFDKRRPGEPKNLQMTEWQLDHGVQVREVTYDLFQDFVITKALINVTVKQNQCEWTTPGIAYGVDNKITNKGPPLSDSFILHEHIRITSTGENKCHFVIVAKGKIESETWAGVNKGAEVLEDHFRKIDKSASKSSPKLVSSKSVKSEDQTVRNNDRDGFQTPSILGSSKWSTHVVLGVICLILILLIICLFKMASTLDKIDQRLESIERVLTLF